MIRERCVYWRLATAFGVKHLSEEEMLEGNLLDSRKATRCPVCHEYWEERWSKNLVAPRHKGSRFCRSGSIASGGEREHCTCDTCF